MQSSGKAIRHSGFSRKVKLSVLATCCLSRRATTSVELIGSHGGVENSVDVNRFEY